LLQGSFQRINPFILAISHIALELRGTGSFLDVSFLFQTAFLEVVIPPDIISEETSGDLMVPEGGSAKLVCKARGFPKPRVVWKREDGGEIILRGGPSAKTRG
jgi:hypothetical protein